MSDIHDHNSQIKQWTWEDFANHAPASGRKKWHRPLDETAPERIAHVTAEDPSRRDFLARVASAGALVLGATMLASKTAQAAYDTAVFKPSVYVAIDTDGTVTIMAHRSEMGTGSRSALPHILADELDADMSRVRVEQALGRREIRQPNTPMAVAASAISMTPCATPAPPRG